MSTRSYSQEELKVLGMSFPYFQSPQIEATAGSAYFLGVRHHKSLRSTSTSRLVGLRRHAKESLPSTDMLVGRIKEHPYYSFNEDDVHRLSPRYEEDNFRSLFRDGNLEDLTKALRVSKQEVVPIPRFVMEIEEKTRERIKECMGSEYHEVRFPRSSFYKIKETATDLLWLTKRFEVDMEKFYDFMTIVRILNQMVYIRDAVAEMTSDSTIWYSPVASAKANIVFRTAFKFMQRIKRPDLAQWIPGMMGYLDVLNESEVAAYQTRINSEYKNMGYTYRRIFEPSPREYLDTGGYGTMFAKFFSNKVKFKEAFLNFWYNSRRSTDITDANIDEEEDFRAHQLSPFNCYIFSMCDDGDAGVLKEALRMGFCTKRVREVTSRHALKLQKRLMSYLQRIDPVTIKNGELKRRVLDISGLGIDIARDRKSAENYRDFYNQSLD